MTETGPGTATGATFTLSWLTEEDEEEELEELLVVPRSTSGFSLCLFFVRSRVLLALRLGPPVCYSRKSR